MTQNNLFPMRDWHVKHMQDTIVKYLTGLPDDASQWQKRIHKKYENLAQVTKKIDYDLMHGVERQEVISFLASIKTNDSFFEVRGTDGFADRLYSLEEGFLNNSKTNTSFSSTDI